MAAAVVVKAVVPGWLSHPRRVSFADPDRLDRDILASKLADAFALRPGSFRLAYRDDDNDLIELATAADLTECIDFFSYGGSNASSAVAPSNSASITLRIEILVEYDGPALSEAGTGTGTGRGLSSVRSLSNRDDLSASRGAETTISSAATDREGALARWKAEQDALAAQFSRLGALGPSTRRRPAGPDQDRLAAEEAILRAARAAEERNQDRRMWTREQDALSVQFARAGLDAGGGGGQQEPGTTATARRRYSGNDASSMGDWVRERAFDVAHGLNGDTSDGLGNAEPAIGDHGVGDDDDDDWDRETVSSFVPFGRTSRLPPPGDRDGTADAASGNPDHVGAALGPRDDEALHPNFASHFVLAEPLEQPWPATLSSGPERPGPPAFAVQAWNASPMFSSPGSSLYSSGYGQGAGGADSNYGPTESERARVEALFAPSEYSASVSAASERALPRAEYRAASAHASSVWHDDAALGTRPSSSQGPGRSTPSGGRDQQTTPPAGAPALMTGSATLVSSSSEEDAPDFTCAVCMDTIDGVRYMCIQCDGYNMCETCENDPGAKAASRRRKNSSAIDSALATMGRTRRQDEYIPMLHDSNHVLLKIKPGATLPRGLGALGLASAGSAGSTPPAPAAPPPPPLSQPTTPLPYLGRAREIPLRLPADGPTRLTRPDPTSSSSATSSSTVPARTHLVPPFRIPAVSIPGFSVLGATVAPVQLPEINIPAVDFPSVHYPSSSATPTGSTPVAAPAPRVLPFAVQPPSFRRFDNIVERNHGVGCSHCGKLIPTGPGESGVRWLCGNCPTVPGYNLCSDCEVDSAAIHDPTHAFLRLTHRLRRPLPSLSSGLVPLLYLPKSDGDDEHLGRKNGTVARQDQLDRPTKEGKHQLTVCDACGQKILDAWMMCCHCPVSFDLCRPCLVERDASTLARHNPSHVFLCLKEPVDLDLLKQVTRFSSRRPRGLIEWDLYS
ncbi:hypothetical protein JCM3774_003759 [Rhodotorula dairenensis]